MTFTWLKQNIVYFILNLFNKNSIFLKLFQLETGLYALQTECLKIEQKKQKRAVLPPCG